MLEARKRLQESQPQLPPREAYLLLSFVLGVSESFLFAHGDELISTEHLQSFRELLERRLQGEPVAYLLGEKEFYGRRFLVDSRVLVPRPETEHLIDLALSLDLPEEPHILDLGAGSGNISVTLACELPKAQLWSIDRSLAALALTQRNGQLHQVNSRLNLVASNWGSALDLPTFDLVVSNPPYIDQESPTEYSPEVARYEPSIALFAPDGGLFHYDSIFAAASQLPSGTPVITEIGRGQLPRLTERAVRFGFEPIRTISDYSAIERTIMWQVSHNPLPPQPA